MRISWRSLSVSAPADMPPPSRFRPFWSPSVPPASTRAATPALDPGHLERDQPVVEQQRVAGRDVARQRLVGDADHLVGAAVRVVADVKHEALTLAQLGAAGGEALDADLRAAQVAEYADDAPARSAARRTSSMRRACAERPPCEKLTRTRSTPDATRSVIARSLSVAGPSVATILVRRCMVFDPPAQPCARCSSIATAGSVRPSTNSRNAPPPVGRSETSAPIP